MSSESRRHPRTPIELKVEYRKLNTFFFDYTRNISKGGTFIKTPRPLEIGTEFVFKLAVPRLDEPLTLKGRVRWIVEEGTVSPDGDDEPGMGIEFVYASDEERDRIEGTVESLMKEQLGERAYSKLMGLS
ncbi:MAG: TIGR02266 family protein [Myxococcales bacterium]|nr:TIGR02266 family protein [Myxococcales bacterium]